MQKTNKKKEKIKWITLTCAKCYKCKDVIISWYRHDFKSCSCKSISIDGGRDYVRFGWSDKVKQTDYKIFTINVPEWFYFERVKDIVNCPLDKETVIR